MVADRQATGYYIASRDIRKIEPPTPTPRSPFRYRREGIEFIRMAQLSFEHYEKMTDSALSSRQGQLPLTIIQRNNLSSLSCDPLLAAGTSATVGRIFEYDGAVAATNEWTSPRSARDRPSPRAPCGWAFAATWTSRARSTSARCPLRSGDNDPSTAGPDFVRSLFP